MGINSQCEILGAKAQKNERAGSRMNPGFREPTGAGQIFLQPIRPDQNAFREVLHVRPGATLDRAPDAMTLGLVHWSFSGANKSSGICLVRKLVKILKINNLCI